MNKLNIFIIYLFALYPVVGYIAADYINVAGHNLMGALVYCVTIITFFKKFEASKFPKYLKYLLFFVIITVFADALNSKIGNVIKYIYSNFYIKSFFVFFLIENIIVLKKHIKKIKLLLILVLVFSLVVFLIQILIDPTFFVLESYLERSIDFDFQYRPPSIFSWNGPAAFGFTIPAIISILVSENYLEKKKTQNYILYSLAVFLSFLSKARWFMLSIVIVIFQIFIYEKGKFIKYTIVTLLSIILAFQIMNYLDINYNRIIEERILEKNKGGLMEGSAGTRILAFKLFFEFYPENPIFGTGGIQTEELKDARGGRTSQIHVGFLSLFYYYGAVGGIFYILFLYFLLKKMNDVAKTTGFWGSFFTMLTFVAANMTLVSLHVFKMGIILALVFHKYYETLYLHATKDAKNDMNTVVT